MAYVYRHIRLDTNKVFYVGVSDVNDNYKRSRKVIARSDHWRNIVNVTDWESEIIFDNLSLKEAKEKEIEFIKIYGRSDLGEGTLVNHTDGGDGTCGYKVLEATKEILKKKNKGKKLSKEHCEKISKSLIGKSLSKDHIKKLSDAKRGKKRSKEAVEKTRLANIGNKSRTGQKASPEMIEKLKIAQRFRRKGELENAILLNIGRSDIKIGAKVDSYLLLSKIKINRKHFYCCKCDCGQEINIRSESLCKFKYVHGCRCKRIINGKKKR